LNRRERTARERIVKRGAPTAWNALRGCAHPKARSGICMAAEAAIRSLNNPDQVGFTWIYLDLPGFTWITLNAQRDSVPCNCRGALTA